MHDRVAAVLRGEHPDRLPFVDRITVWFACHSRAGTIPPEFAGMTMTEIHRAVGIGQQQFVVPYLLRLRGAELIAHHDGQEILHEIDPCVEFFCGMFDFLDAGRPGTTVVEMITPVGRLRARYELTADGVRNGTEHYILEHWIKDEADYRTVETLIENAEIVPRFERVAEAEARLGEIGFVVPMIPRVPFQQVLLEYLGEVPLFYALADRAAPVERLMAALDRQMLEIIDLISEQPWLYVEFPDNLHGLMTNPRLFARYNLGQYQRYCQALHAQGKKVGSHTDGDVRPLLGLLAESGLDVCESFSPAPLTACTFDEAWQAWRGGPQIWGGIPSPYLEERTDEAAFQAYVGHVLDLVGDGLMILGVGDLVMGNNAMQRVRYIAQQVEARESRSPVEVSVL